MTDDLARRRTMMPAPVAASALAHGEDEGGEIVHEVLAFALADESYALPLRAVREILKVPAITLVPRAPADILGIIAVRGRIITVLDLRRRLRMSESRATKATRVLLVDDGHEVIGMLVDRVLSVYRLREEEVELATVMGGDMGDHVVGVGRPRAGRGRGAAEAQASDDILILLDPLPLLRR